MVEIKRYKLNAVSLRLNDIDPLAADNEFMEVSLWHNGEGFDVTLTSEHFELTWAQYRALKKLLKALEAN